MHHQHDDQISNGSRGASAPLHEQAVKKSRTSVPAAMLTVVACATAPSFANGMVVTTRPTSSAKNAQALLNQARFLHQQRAGEAVDDSLVANGFDDSELFDTLSIFPTARTPKKGRQDVVQSSSWTEALFDDMAIVGDEVDELQKLQRATGSEIPNEELQRQIDQAKATAPEAFLDAHVQDASLMEKVAMSSLPQQLPRPAVAALTSTVTKTRKAATRKSNKSTIATTKKLTSKKSKKVTSATSQGKGLDYASKGRVSHEQELELARQIQKGVALHKLKTDFEAEHGREISRQEWTDLAGLDSANELRRQVSTYRQAKQLLVEANMGLVHAVVKAQYKSLGRTGISFEEVVQEGSLGLLRAAELFDPSRGLRFSTYATIWIKGHLSNTHMVEPITLPAREKTKWNKICKAHEDLVMENNNSGDPTPQEIAARVNMSVEEVMATKRKMTQAQQVLSLDYEYKTTTRSGTDNGSMSSLQHDKAFMADVDLAERTQLHADVVAALAQNLDAREARLVRLRYGLADGQTRSISQCAECMGLSQSRVQQLAKRCLKKLREAHNAQSLQEYLLTIA